MKVIKQPIHFMLCTVLASCKVSLALWQSELERFRKLVKLDQFLYRAASVSAFIILN